MDIEVVGGDIFLVYEGYGDVDVFIICKCVFYGEVMQEFWYVVCGGDQYCCYDLFDGGF